MKRCSKVFAACVAMSSVAVLVSNAATSSAYVREGLIACWDGVENDGRSGLHVSSLTEWRDTIANRPFMLTGVTVEKDRIVFSGNGETSYGILSLDDTKSTFEQCQNGTVEVVLCPDKDSTSAIAVMGSSLSRIALGYSGILLFSCGDAGLGFPGAAFNWCGSTNTISAVYASKTAYVNGVLEDPAGADYYTLSTEQANIGRRSNGANGLKGAIYCIRLYNRALTTEEIAANHAVDVERFEKGNNRHDDGTVSLEVTTHGIQYAENGLPAYGITKGHLPGERITVSAPKSVRITGARHVACRGWALERLIDDDWQAWQSGSGATCAFDCPKESVRLVWRWSERDWVRELPTAYQQVQYIESTGEQWINTQVKATTNLASQVDLSFVIVPGDTSVLGARTSDRIYLFHVYGGFCYGYGSYYSSDVSPEENRRYRVETVLRDGYQELAVYDALDASPILRSGGVLPNEPSYDIQQDLSLFGLNNSGSVGGLVSAKCYSTTIWSVDDEGNRALLRDFVPCFKKSDEKVAGLYDFVSGEFFGDSGMSGVPFKVGPKVESKGLVIMFL